MARISRREKARRQAIAKGMRRYWRNVRKYAKQNNVPLQRARQRLSKKKVVGEPLLPPVAPPFRTQAEYAFNLQDRDSEEGWNLDERIRGRPQTWRVSWTLYDENRPGQQVDSGDGEISFETAGGYAEFWSNYFAACREFLKGIPGGYEGQELTIHVPLRFIPESESD